VSTAISIRDLVGKDFGPSEWLPITQDRVDAFAEATNDPQWIHVDPERAAAGPFGGTIAHGFLTLSLCVPLMAGLVRPPGYTMGINYGVNRVRFPSPLPVGSRIRARFHVESVEEVAGGDQAVIQATVEREGGDKPVCVAELVVRYVR
jgi:acyl dehydratase